ncbi:MAG: hypothetical protein ACYDBB_25200 [Armatimonadota bacterium]
MMLSARHLCLWLLLCCCALWSFAAPVKFSDGQARPVTRTFQLKEWLEHEYTDELVSYPTTFAVGECRMESLRLLDDTGREVTYQLADVKKAKDGSLRSATIWFWVDKLPAMGQRMYTLYGSKSSRCKAPVWKKSPIAWTSLNADTVEVSNSIYALKLAGNKEFAQPEDAVKVGGPLRNFKGADGVWRGSGELQTESAVIRHALKITELGPLWTTFVSRFDFVAPPGTGGMNDGPYYEMTFKVYPGRDFCRISEKSDFPLRLKPMPRDVMGLYKDPKDPNALNNWRNLPCPADNFILNCDTAWKPDYMYAASVRSEALLNFPLLPEQMRVQTAVRPVYPTMDAGWFSVYNSKAKDLIGLVGVDARLWQYPDNAAHETAGSPGRNTDIMFLNEPGKGAYFRLPLSRMQRHWLLVVTAKDKVVRDEKWLDEHKTVTKLGWSKAKRLDTSTCYLWELRYKFGDLPLNKVKDWILDYNEPQAAHPRLFPEMKDPARVMKNVESLPGLMENFNLQYNQSPYLQYLKTGVYQDKEPFDPFNGITCVQEHMEVGFNANMYVLSMGQYVPWMFQFSDMVAPKMTPENWKKMVRFSLAGMYILSDDDYWQYAYVPGRTTYLPNFNTVRWYSFGLAGMMFPNHPMAKTWLARSQYYLEMEFTYNISKDGMGAENIGSYWPFAWRMINQLIYTYQQNGIADYRNDPRYLRCVQAYLDVITPKDPRFNPPRRMIPPIGNHPYSAPGQSGLYEWNAVTNQKVNPELAAWSHWAWLESGQPADYHYLMPLNALWASKDFEAKAPALKSLPIEGFGYFFRNHFPSDKETYMAFKAGQYNYHYDNDEGSFHMFAKGVPLACDGLTLLASDKASHHNTVVIAKEADELAAPQRAGEIPEHFESDAVDWASAFFAKEKSRGVEFWLLKPHQTDWRRDIMLVKAKNPDDAEYFVVYDNLSGSSESSWHLDVHSEEPTIEEATATSPAVVHYPGIRKPNFNVGLDVFFVTPSKPAITKEKGEINKAQLPSFPIIEHWYIHSSRAPKEDTLAILFPRAAGQPVAKVTSILGGRGCIVEHQNGRDFIFASVLPMTYNENGIDFTGRFAIVRDRGADSSITLLDGTKLSFKGKVLTEKGNMGL